MAAKSNKGLAIVTGASGGIGYELAKCLAADGYPLMLVARSREKLEAIAADFARTYGVQATPLAGDLTVPLAASDLARVITADGRPIEVLINNAGVGVYGPFAEQPLGKVLELLQLNIVALTELTHRLLPALLATGQGRIMNVASTAAFQPGPLMAVYYASKAYVLHFSEALAFELRKQGVTVTALCPGPTTTDFEARADMQESRLFASRRIMTAEAVARVGYRAMSKGHAVSIPGFSNRFLAWCTRLPPRSWLPRIAAAMMAPK